MFPKSNFHRNKVFLLLMTMLLFGGFLTFGTGSTPTASAQTTFDVYLRINAPTYVQPGQNMTYEFKVENLTSNAYPSSSFFTYIPANTTYVSGGTYTSGATPYVTLSVPALAANGSHTVSYVVQANSSVPVGTVIENDGLTGFFTPPFNVGYFKDSTLVEAPPTTVLTLKNNNGTPYDVKVNSFGFDNYTNVLPAGRTYSDDLGAADLFMMFGSGVCQSGTTAADCVLSAPAKAWATTQIDSLNGGHCDGMATTNLRMFNSLPFKNYSTPATFQSGAVNIVDLNFPAQPIENYQVYYHSLWSFVSNQYYKAAPNDIVARISQGLNATPPIPYVVSFYNADFSKGHSVAAIGLESATVNGKVEVRIIVYDNNFPKQRQYIKVDPAANTWSYTTSATPGTTASVYSGNATSNNLWILDNNLRDLPAGQTYACPFCTTSGSAAKTTSADGSASDLFTHEIDFQFTGEGAILVVNDEGQSIGKEIGATDLINEIPGAEFFHFTGGLDKEIPPKLVIPISETNDTFYDVYVHGTTVDDPSNGLLSIHGPGFSIGVYDIHLDPHETFEFSVSPDGDHISFYATEDITAPEIYIAHDPIHPGDPSVIFDIEGVVLLAGEKVMLDLDPELEQIHFNHTGPEAEDFIIDMQLIWPDGHVEDYAEEIHAPAGTHSVYIDFGAWDGLEHPATYIDDVLQNPSVNHRLKLIDAVGTYDPTPQTDAPAGVYHVEATFQNVTEVSFSDVYFTVANLGLGDVLLNADAGSLGTRVSVPADLMGADGWLHTNESFTFSFGVGLADMDFADLTVDANGVPHDWIHPDPAPSYDANNASFVFDGMEALPNQLDLLANDVQALADSGELNQIEAARLLQNLDIAEQALDGQSDHQVIRQLRMFLARVRWNGNLSDEAKAPLIAQAQFLVQQLQVPRNR